MAAGPRVTVVSLCPSSLVTAPLLRGVGSKLIKERVKS